PPHAYTLALHAALPICSVEADLAPAPAEAAPVSRAKLDPRPLDQIRAFQRPGAPSVVGKVIGMYLKTAPELLTKLRTATVEKDRDRKSTRLNSSHEWIS